MNNASTHEAVYSINNSDSSPLPAEIYAHPIVKTTPKRVYVQKAPADETAPAWQRDREGNCILDRAKLEEEGRVYHRASRTAFYLHREDAEARIR